jgi:hypothetical protein
MAYSHYLRPNTTYFLNFSSIKPNVTNVAKHLSAHIYLTGKLFYMKKNLSNADRIIRLIAAAIFAILYFTNTVSGTFGIVLLLVGVVLALTSLVSFCPLYAILGLNTCVAKNEK